MFRSIEPEDLVPGEKYLIGPHGDEWYYVREMYYKQRYCVFESVKHSKPNNQFQISPHTDFYEFVPQKERIQSEMERRAVNLIVRRLLGDDCFEW
jgi:hypothetical protein